MICLLFLLEMKIEVRTNGGQYWQNSRVSPTPDVIELTFRNIDRFNTMLVIPR